MMNWFQKRKKIIHFGLFLAVGISLSFLLPSFLAWKLWTHHSQTQTKVSKLHHLDEILGRIQFLSQELRKTTQMAALSKDPKWEINYLEFKSQLNHSLNSFLRSIPLESKNAAEELQQNHFEVVDYEKKIFDLLKKEEKESSSLFSKFKKETDSTQPLLEDVAYEKKKAQLILSIQNLEEFLKSKLNHNLNSQKIYFAFIIFSFFLSVILLCFMWYAIFKKWKMQFPLSKNQEIQFPFPPVSKARSRKDYFQDVTLSIAKSLNIPIAFICRTIDTNQTKGKTLALWIDGIFQENIIYPYKDSPCELVKKDGEVIYTNNLQESFPKDPWLTQVNAQSYVALPVFDSSHQFIGHLGVIHRKAISREKGQRILSILRIFASGVGQEVERIKAQEAIGGKVDRSNFFQNIPEEGIWVLKVPTDEEQRFRSQNKIWFSPRLKEMLGYKDAEFKNVLKSLFKIMPADRVNQFARLMKKHLEDRSPFFEMELPLIIKSGETRWFQVRGHTNWDENSNPIHISGSLRDITPQKKAEEALLQSEQRFHQLAENIQEVFWMADPEKKKMIYISSGYENIWGRTCESLYELPNSWLDFIHSEDRERVEKAAQEKQARGKYDEEYRIIRPDGEIRWIRDRAFPISNEKGEIYRICGIAEDISKIKEGEQKRKNLEEQLRQSQKLEAIGTLAGGIAHDFNNMLAGILGNTDLLKIYSKKGDEVFGAAEAIERAAKRAANLTKQLLDFSRQGNQQKTEVDIHEVLEDVLSLLKPTLKKKTQIIKKFHAEKHWIEGDPNQIEQVVLNLLVNARNAISSGGKIIIKTKEISTFDNPQGGFLQLSVIDNGVGIPLEIQERIFDPFFTTHRDGQGTGMGLAIVYGIVRNHGGTINVTSQPQKGARFDVTFPIMEKSTAVEKSIPSSPSSSKIIEEPGKILAVEKKENIPPEKPDLSR